MPMSLSSVTPHRLRWRRFTASWALIALLLAALAPTVSHAMAAAQGTSTRWVEVCTAQGMRLVQVGVEGAGVEQDGLGEPTLTSADAVLASLEHCPYCTPAGSAPGLIGASSMLSVVLPDRQVAQPASCLEAPRTPFVWAPAQPHPPPVFH